MLEVSLLTTSPDEAEAINTINGIYDYVRAQRVNVPKYPAILPLISSFEGWYQGLEESTKVGIITHIVNLADVNEAKRRRGQINDTMGQAIPSNQTPADAPQTAPDKPPETPNYLQQAIGAVAILGAAYLAYKLIG
jgi:hypothetical protein